MEAIVMNAFGGPEVLRHQEVPTPAPRSGRVLVRVEAAGVNYYDVLIRSGAVSSTIPLPHIGGSDVVGVIQAKADDVSGWQVGDRVIVAPGYPIAPEEQSTKPENEAPSYFPAGTYEWGGYAQYMEVSARWLLKNDIDMPAVELATIPLVLVTAVHAVKTLGEVGVSSKVLVQGGAAGSGSMAIQVAKALGAQVITTVSTPAKAAVARAAGADEVIFYREQKVADTVLEWTRGNGVDVVIDPVGGTTLGDSLRSLKPRGVIVNFGLSAGAEARIPHLYPFFRNELRLRGAWMGSMAELAFGLELIRKGQIRASLDKILPLREAREAHRLIEEHAVSGKLALLPWAA